MPTPYTLTRIADLKAGDTVVQHGATFRVTEDAHDSIGHAPKDPATGWHLGPAGVAHAKAVCVEGSVPGYFWPGSEWAFQGATFVTVHRVDD